MVVNMIFTGNQHNEPRERVADLGGLPRVGDKIAAECDRCRAVFGCQEEDRRDSSRDF